MSLHDLLFALLVTSMTASSFATPLHGGFISHLSLHFGFCLSYSLGLSLAFRAFQSRPIGLISRHIFSPFWNSYLTPR